MNGCKYRTCLGHVYRCVTQDIHGPVHRVIWLGEYTVYRQSTNDAIVSTGVEPHLHAIKWKQHPPDVCSPCVVFFKYFKTLKDYQTLTSRDATAVRVILSPLKPHIYIYIYTTEKDNYGGRIPCSSAQKWRVPSK